MVSDFVRDNEWQRKVRDSVLAPGFYGSYAVDGRYVFIDKGRLATTLQRSRRPSTRMTIFSIWSARLRVWWRRFRRGKRSG